MCRYGMSGPYKEKWACFECRKSFKQISRYELRHPMPVAEDDARLVLCPQCRGKMCNMGLDFQAPWQTDAGQWKKVELLFAHGYNYSSCGCNGPGYRPARLKEVPLFLEQQTRNAEKWQRQAQVTARAAELKSKRKKKRKLIEDKRHDRLARTLTL